MGKYDDASWHYEGDFPEGLPEENGATHIGMFLTWCIDNNLISDFQQEESRSDIEKVKRREMTGAAFLIDNCDEKFTDEDLNDLGNGFAEDYYNDDSNFGKVYGSYTSDYSAMFDRRAEKGAGDAVSIYHVDNTFDNYNLLRPVLDKRFEEWRQYKGL